MRGAAIVLGLLGCALGASGCLTPRHAHALDYVVLPNHEQARQGPTPEELAAAQARDAKDEAHYPIYGDHPPAKLGEGMGGAGCSVGLIGDQCEVGLLTDETPLAQQHFLGPDGIVSEDSLRPEARSGAKPALQGWIW